MTSLMYAKESVLLKVLQDVADNDKRTQTLELMGSTVWKGKSASLTASLAEDTAEDLIARGLHEGLDEIQAELAGVTDALGREFFLLAEPDGTLQASIA